VNQEDAVRVADPGVDAEVVLRFRAHRGIVIAGVLAPRRGELANRELGRIYSLIGREILPLPLPWLHA
jgi:hypothetical protein